MRRVGIFGWGIVAPECETVSDFAQRLEAADSWLSPFDGFGPSNFLVGAPTFDFDRYRSWITERFTPNRYRQLVDKMDPTALFAVGAFIQSLEQNPGLDAAIRDAGTAAHVYLGTCFGALPTLHDASLAWQKAQRRWDRFWAQPERCTPLFRVRHEGATIPADAPPDPSNVEDPDDRYEAEGVWNGYWAVRSEALSEYLQELAAIEGLAVGEDVDQGKLTVIREKRKRLLKLEKRFGAPLPPWCAVGANVLWNLPNVAASQISMLAGIRGPAIAPAAACSTFGVSLQLAWNAIQSGDARVAVVGAADPPPHPLSVGSFYEGRVLSADGRVSKPLTELRGTHVAGGAAVWIVADLDWAREHGFEPVGLEVLGVSVTSDADHIITPSREGPQQAVEEALARAGVAAAEVGSWDLHATATPGDHREVENLRSILPETVLVTARKGTFGHGMSVAGGWELTAQHLGVARGSLHPTPLAEGELHPAIRALHRNFVGDVAAPMPKAAVGKMSMGVGGINACVVSRPWA